MRRRGVLRPPMGKPSPVPSVRMAGVVTARQGMRLALVVRTDGIAWFTLYCIAHAVVMNVPDRQLAVKFYILAPGIRLE